MRRFVLAVLALSMVAGCKLHHELASVVGFEGEIEMSMGGGTQIMKIKGSKVRAESPAAPSAATITDIDAKKSWIVDHVARSYTEVDLAAASKTSSGAAPSSKTKAVKTGRSDAVAGQSCDVWNIEDASGAVIADVCVASGLHMMAMGLGGPFSAFSQGGDAWSVVYSHGFPLRMEMRDAKGAPMMKMEATRIERKSIPDAEFQIPAGYTKLAWPI